MNRNYKVIWNQSLNCFMAVAEYAKSRGKSSSTVSSTSTASAAVSSGAKLLRLSALSVGLVSAGFSVQSVAGYEAGGGSTFTNCTRDSNGGFSGEATSIALGNGVLGNVACASGPETIAIGANLAATGSQATAIGNDIIASGDQSVVIGSNFNTNPTTSTGAGGVAIGSGLTTALYSPTANGIGSVAIGSSGNNTANSNNLNGAIATGNHALALMSGANASATNSIALGTSATANIANSVALGSGSTTAAYVRTQTGTVNGKTYTYAGAPATSSTVSIGASGTERTLTNLAAGRVSATSTDGINGSQLFQTNTELGNLAANTASALGGGSAAGTAAGGITAPSYTITKTDGTNYAAANNVGTALSNLNTEVIKSITFTGNSGSSTRKLGETLTISGGLAGASSNSNVKTVVTGNTVDIQIANAPVFTGQVKANGFDASGAKIINVAKGTNATDAVNFSQLAESELTSSVVAGNNTSVSSATTGNNTAYTVNAKKSTVSAGSTAVAVTPGTETNDTTNYAVDLSAATKTSLGKADTAVQTISSNDSNLTAVKTGNNVTFDFADAPVFTGQVKASGFDASGAKIINVVDGSVAANSQDAVNGGQLFNTADSVASVIGGNAANTDGVITATNIGGTGQDNINDAISNVKGAATAAKTTVTEGENIVVTETVDDTTGASNYEVKTKRDLALDSVTTGNSVLNNDGVTITDGSNITAVTSAGTSVTDGTNTSNYGATGLTITGGPSVTSAGINAGNKKITNVDNGSVTLNSKEAINGGQLFNTADSVASVIGGNAANTDGVITATNIGGTGQDNINDAISNVKGAATAAKTTVTEGENIVVTETVDDTTGASNYEVKTKRDLALDSVTTGNSVLNNDGVTITDGSNITAVTSAGTSVTDGTNTSNYGATGLTITGGPSVTSAGINAGNKKITNVDNGSVTLNSKEAINGGQLFNTADSVASVIGGNAANTDGVITATNIGGTGQDNINDAISNVKGAATAAKTTVTEGENIVVTETVDDTTGASNYEVKTKRDLALDSVTTGNSVLNNDGVTITDGSNITAVTSAGTSVTDGTNTSNYGATGLTITGGPSVTSAGINAGNKKITNVDNGSVTLNSKEAINGGQLFNTADSVASVIGGNAANTDGVITATNIGGTGQDNINDAISNVKGAATAAKTTVTEGENIVVTETVDDTTGASNYEVKTKRDLALDSVTTGNSVLNNDGVTITDGSNITAVTSAGTSVTDGTNTSNYGATGLTITGGPSVTSAGINAGNKKITNVDNGSVTLNSKEAINGGQLFNTADSVASVIGGNAANTDGVITATNIGGTGQDNINDAISNVKGAATAAKTTVTEGENIVVTETVDDTTGASNYEVKTKRDLALDSVTTGNSVLNNDGVTITDGSNITAVTSAGTSVTDGTNTSNYGATGLTITGGPSVTSAGINAGNKKITNVDNGSVTLNSKEAINGGQLFNTADSVASVIGGNAANTDGVITATNIGGTGQDNINDAISNVKGAATAAKTTVTEGENIVVTETVDDTTGASNYEVKTKRDLALDSVTTGNSVLNNDGVTITDGSNITAVTSAGTSVTDGTNTSNYGATGLTITGGPSVTSAGINAGNKKITNVDNGSVTLNSKEAINGGQLFNTADSVASVIGGNAANTDGVITATNIGGTGQDNINDAISNVKGAATAAKTTVTEGENIVVTETVDDTTGASNYEVKTKRDLALDSVTTGNSVLNNDGVTITDGSNITAVTSAGTSVTDGTNTSNYGATGLTITGGPSVTSAGINAGNKKITNVDNGSVTLNSKEAINGGQLFNTADSVASVIGGNAANTDGVITATNIGGTGQDNINDAISNVKGAATAAKTTVTEGENIVVTETVDDTTGASNYEVKTKRDLALDSVTTGNSVLNNDGVTITDGSNITAVTSAGTSVTDGTNTSNYGATGLTITGGPSVTSAGINAGNKKITNVDNGSVTLNSKEAINGGQLFNTADSVASVIGGNAANTDGVITATNIGGTGQDNINDAISNVKGAATAAKTTVTEGENIVVTETVDDTTGASNYEVKTKRDLALDSVTTGNSVLNNDGVTITDGSNITAVTSAGTSVTDGTNTSNYGATGLTITGGPSVTSAGINAGNKKITNVDNGSVTLNSKEAINGGQLFNTADSVASVIGGNAANTDGVITATNIGGTGQDNINDAISNVKGAATAAKTTVTEGENIVVTETVDDTTGASNYEVKTKRDLALDSVTTGNSVLNNDGVTITDGSNITAVTSAGTSVTDGTNTSNYGATGLTITGGPSVTSAGINAGNKKITNVDNGSVTLNSKEAINGGQLFNTADSVASVIGGNAANTDGVITATNIGGTGQDNINDAISNVKGAATAAKTTVTEGENIVVTETVDDTTGASNYEVKTKRDLALDSVTTGNSVLNNDGVTITDGSNITAVTSAGTSVTDGTNTSNYGATGLTITGGPSVTSAGINAGNKKITNVDNGSVTLNSKEAINGGQLFNTADSVASVIGGNAANTDGVITATNIGGTGQDNINDAISNVKGAATAAKTTVTEGENIVVTETVDDTTGASNYEVKTKRDLALDSVTTGNSVLNNDGVTITDGSNITAVTSAGTSVTDGTNTSNYGATGLTITGGPSVTSAGINAGNKKITNVDNGSVTLNSKEAINGGQLFNTADSVASVIGGNAANTDGVITATNIGGTGQDNINDAISNVKGAATAAKTTVTEGENIVVTETVDDTTGASNYEVKTKRDLALDSVTTGNSVLNNDGVTITDGSNITAVTSAGTSVTDGTNTSNYGATGLTITGGPSVTSAGINAGNKKITNVDNGSVTLNSKEAINGGQLFNTADSVASVIGGNAANTDGVITATNIGGTGQDNINDAISNVKGAATAAKTTVTEGENIVVTETVDDTTGASNYEVKTKRDLALDSVTTGNSVLNNDGVTITDGSNITAVTSAGTSVTDGTNTSNYGATGLTITGGPSVTSAGINAGNKKITNVDNGSVTLNSKEAINGGQLFNTADSVASVIGGNAANTDGVITATNIGGTGQDNINDAISNVKGAATAAKTTVTEGENIVVTETVDDTTGASNYEVKTKRDLALDSVTTGNSVLNNDGVTITDGSNITAVTSAGTSVTDGTNTSNYGATGLTITGGPSVTSAGINAGNKKITNVDNGSVTLNSKEAINGGQLFNTADSVASVIGGNAANTDGVITATNIGGTGQDNINDAISNVKGAATAAKTTVTEGENIVVTETVDDTTGASNYEVKTKRDLALDSVTTGNSVLNNDGVTITDGSNITAVTSAGTSVTDGTNTSNYGADGFTVTDATGNSSIFNQGGISFTDTQGDVTGPSITASGINAGDTVITNVGDAVNAKDAVNKGQLDVITGNITAGGVQYNRNPDNTVNYDQVSFAGTPTIVGKDDNDNDIVVSGGTTLTNVANGINASDAVNKGQLDSVTKVKVFDKNGDEITVNIADQVVNNNVNNNDLDSLFLTYNKEGQEVTDRLTIGETVQKMNTEGVKFAHTNASSQSKGDIASGVTNDSSAGGLDSTAIGVNAIIEAKADNTVALGLDTLAKSTAKNSVVIGKGSKVAGESSIAIGDSSQANGKQSISIGTKNIVNGDRSGAFGDPSIINGNNSYSVGNNNTINSDDTFVLGNGITANQNGSVVLGLGSAAMTGAGVLGFGAAGNSAIMATTSTTGSVAVGDAANGVYRQVTGVAAGTADSDAVNVSQLKAVSDALESSNETLSNAAVQYDKNQDGDINKGSITLGGGAAGTTITNVKGGAINAGSTDAINGGQLHNLGSDVAGIIGGDATYDADGNLTANNIGGTGKGNISDAIASINQGNAQANEDIKVNTDNIQANTDRLDAGLSFGADNGDNINKPVGDGTALKFEGSDNITTTTTGSGIKFDLNGNISVDSVTTGNTTVNTNGVTIKDGPSITTEGINAGNKTITGVADGIEVNDAVNLGQLNALDGKLSNSVNELGYKINEVEDDANAGISAAMAMSSLPQAYIPGKSMVGGGIATYNGQSAVAIGVSKVSDNGRWVIKVNGTADTQGNAGGAVGAGFHF